MTGLQMVKVEDVIDKVTDLMASDPMATLPKGLIKSIVTDAINELDTYCIMKMSINKE